MRLPAFCGALQGLLLLVLFSLQTTCSSDVPSNTAESLSEKLNVLRDRAPSRPIRNVIGYLVEPTEASLRRYAASYFFVFRCVQLDGQGALFELKHAQIDTTLPSGLLLIAMRIVNNFAPGETGEARKGELMVLRIYALQFLYGLNLLRGNEFLGPESGRTQAFIESLRKQNAYCPGVSANPFIISPLLALALCCVIDFYNEFNTAVIAQRCSELYASALRNYPLIMCSFKDLSLVSVEAALQIYDHPNHVVFFSHDTSMKTVSSEVLLRILNLHDWDLGTEQVEALVVARGKERLLSEICNDCRAWQITRLISSEHGNAASEADTQELFFDFDWEPFQYCAPLKKAVAEGLLCPIQLKTAFLRYIVAIERYLHNALVMLRRTLDWISEYSGLDDADILENAEHRESLEPYIDRVRKVVDIRMELREMFKPEYFDSLVAIEALLTRPLSHRIRTLLHQKDAPLYLHLLRETNHKLQDVYSLGDVLPAEIWPDFKKSNGFAPEAKMDSPVMIALSLSTIWIHTNQRTSLDESRFTVDLMFLLVDGVEAPEDYNSASGKAYVELLSRLKGLVLNHAQYKILQEDVDYVASICHEHPIASELQDALVSPISVGPFERAVKDLCSLYNMFIEVQIWIVGAFKCQDKEQITQQSNLRENVIADVCRVVRSFTICELIDRILPRLRDFPNILEMLAGITDLLSRAQIDELVALFKGSVVPMSVTDFVSSSYGQRILSNVGVLFLMEWDQLPAIMVKSMALATSSMPGWKHYDVLAIYQKCDGIIHNFDSWLTLIPAGVWRGPDVASVVGIEASFFSMFKVPMESIYMYSSIPCTAALWLFDNIEGMRIEAVSLFITKWMVRWELNFVQWRVYLRRLPRQRAYAFQACLVYLIMHAYEARARSLMIAALKKLSESSMAKGLVAQLRKQPASLCRLSYLKRRARDATGSLQRKMLTIKDYREMLSNPMHFSSGGDVAVECTKFHGTFVSQGKFNFEALDVSVTQSMQSTFPKFEKGSLSEDAMGVVDRDHSTIASNMEGFLRKYEECPLQKTLWLTRLKLCAAVDADGIVSDPAMMEWIKECLQETHKDYKVLPANDLVFMQLLSESPESQSDTSGELSK